MTNGQYAEYNNEPGPLRLVKKGQYRKERFKDEKNKFKYTKSRLNDTKHMFKGKL
jgi:hypothetical protein